MLFDLACNHLATMRRLEDFPDDEDEPDDDGRDNDPLSTPGWLFAAAVVFVLAISTAGLLFSVILRFFGW